VAGPWSLEYGRSGGRGGHVLLSTAGGRCGCEERQVVAPPAPRQPRPHGPHSPTLAHTRPHSPTLAHTHPLSPPSGGKENWRI
jgi:hypothetical protein